MKKLTEEQNKRFDELFEEEIMTGFEGECFTGLFCDLLDSNVDHDSHNLYYLTICMQDKDQQIEVLEFDGCGYHDLIGYIPYSSETKTTLEKIVVCLMNGGSFTDLRKFVE